MKYFFLSQGWTIGRVWEFGGLWHEEVWGRRPEIKCLNLKLTEHGEVLWLHQVEDAVLMLEVNPPTQLVSSPSTIGQVMLKRLITAEQVIERLTTHSEPEST
ncbi:hypothetical protein [Gloeocapsa sp. PCC 73106]|uniref:hypothetical protein n=1 Tax=Gloeocapsa sp. PCC 73106 TaxID=102232 RepID=UPI0002ACC1B0|nr:hypothetical protein [Gloeocapsa sp. PCC 73106]ELR98221.1 hypothetical protein GLO73106DRAFT_00020480 [Gloeocapsa sp. PCC 73106]